MPQVLHVGKNAGMKRRREIADVEKNIVDQIRADKLTNAETIGRPIVLFRDSTFVILFGGMIDHLCDVPLRTLRAFSEDIHGGGLDPAHADRLETNRTLDCDNLKSSEFIALTKVLAACIEAEEKKEQKVVEAVGCIANPS